MMHDVMYTTGSSFGFSLLWAAHMLAVLLFAVGILFLILWAVKNLKPGQLKTWGVSLAIAGAVLCLITIAIKGSPWTAPYGMHMGMMGGATKCGPMEMMAGDAMDDDMHGMMGGDALSMNGMSMMLQGKTGDAFDEAFIQMMIPHHQGAIDMANDALKNAQHEELKQLARDIIDSQQREIDMMKNWQGAWGYTE